MISRQVTAANHLPPCACKAATSNLSSLSLEACSMFILFNCPSQPGLVGFLSTTSKLLRHSDRLTFCSSWFHPPLHFQLYCSAVPGPGKIATLAVVNTFHLNLADTLINGVTKNWVHSWVNWPFNIISHSLTIRCLQQRLAGTGEEEEETDEVSAPCRRRHMWPVCKCRHVIAHQAAAWEETQSSLPSRRLRHTLTPVSQQPACQSVGRNVCVTVADFTVAHAESDVQKRQNNNNNNNTKKKKRVDISISNHCAAPRCYSLPWTGE